MNREQIQEIIFRVLSQYKNEEQELPLDFPVEVSSKHVHLTEEAIEKLFGPGEKLTPKRPLSQPGQYLSEERVSIVTPHGQIENVAVLGPARSAIQTELSVTDCRTLGIQAPLRMSGDLSGAADVYLVGPKGMINAKGSAIVAKAHVHITPPEAEKIGIKDGQQVSVTLGGERKVTLENVICRVSDKAALAMHIDFDEANACMLPKNATARMRVQNPSPEAGTLAGKLSPALAERDVSAVKSVPEPSVTVFTGKLITEAVARDLAAKKPSSLTLQKGVIVTPSAKDVFNHTGIEIVWQMGR